MHQKVICFSADSDDSSLLTFTAFDFFRHLLILYLAIQLSCSSVILKILIKKCFIMLSGKSPRHSIECTILKGYVGTPLYGVRDRSPWVENGFRAFHRANLSSQDTQVNTVDCFFSSKTKLNTLRP